MRKKFFLLTTIPTSLNFFRGQISQLDNFYEVMLVSSPSPLLKEIVERENVDFYSVKMERDISLWNDVISLLKLVLLFIKQKPYIVHCNTPKASLLGLLASFITRVPRRIYYIHGLRYEGTHGVKRKVLINLERLSCWCATDIIAVSSGVKKTVQKELTNKPITIIHNGSANGMFIKEFLEANYNETEVCAELEIGNEDFVYGFVGRLVGDKGINELVAAFKKVNDRYPKTKLLLVGGYEDRLDPLKEETLKEMRANPNIVETGFQKDVKKYLSIMNILVSPSYREGFGLSLLEANLMGRPVIATKITGYSEIVKEDINGFLIEPKNVNALVEKMEWAYLNSDKLAMMKQDCISEVVKNYNHDDVLREAIDYYRGLKNRD